MNYDFLFIDAVLYDGGIFAKITPKILPEIIHLGKGVAAETCSRIAFMDGYYTSLKFPQEAANSTERQAQKMNYEYCVQTMAGLMKKYASEILN